ncbi:CoA transferase [Phototrophicus methaneseepsis]|uniref:CoA transferase n=1 Tax=Phototrophicus methaneseepsis TaxID=2710758 RepID=A0A7S8EBK4_9CHLR|nr:CoA transferase [Phototrophicus methaneseepsis]QPC83962.1 CoA transferase [Phototrophicus methaneseepsis]
MSRPLEHVRVLDFTRIFSGPYTTLLFADMGAEVVKVEHPEYGDDSRLYGPIIGDTSGYFETLNRGKKSIAIDYRSEHGQQILRQLTPHFDIVVENFRVGQMARYGLDYPVLRELNPRLVYASISGYGQFGDKAHLGCYDIVAQAASGLMSLTGLPQMPLKTGPAIADAISGLTAAVGILGALFRREKMGEGAYVDVAMVDSVFAILENTLATYSATQQVPDRQGNTDAAIAPFDAFEVMDGWVVLAIGNNRLWQRFVSLVGEHINRPEFANNELRLQNYNQLRSLIADWLAHHPTETALKLLQEAQIPSGPIRTIDELATDAQLEARDMLLKVQVDDEHLLTVPGSPIHISGASRTNTGRAPKLGEHTSEILAELEAVSH